MLYNFVKLNTEVLFMKRLLCVLFAVLVLMTSVVTFSASAEDMTSTDCIYFQVPTATTVAWKNFSIVFCHIWQEGDDGGDFYAWQAKDERCEDLGNGYWKYDISGFEFKEDATYSVIFSNENGMQTYNLTLTSDCKGDIVVCEGDSCENPVDNQKQCAVARWTTNKDKVHPCAAFSSDGVLLDPDGIFYDDIDKKWGNAEGTSIAMPEVVVPTEPETEPESEDEITNDNESSTTTGVTFGLGVIGIVLIAVGGVVFAGAAVVIIILIVKKKK